MHLLPAAALVAALLLGWLQPWPGALHNFIGQVGGILVCLCGSVTYHTLMAHQQKYRTWLAVDVSCGLKHCFAKAACASAACLAQEAPPKRTRNACMCAPQVCGIFVLFLSGVQVVAWWGLR
jgi:hypothetical protein